MQDGNNPLAPGQFLGTNLYIACHKTGTHSHFTCYIKRSKNKEEVRAIIDVIKPYADFTRPSPCVVTRKRSVTQTSTAYKG